MIGESWVVKKLPHKWTAVMFGDGGRGIYVQVWQSLKYLRLQMYIYGKKGNPEGTYIRYAIAGWHPAEVIVDEISEAVRVCREDLYCDYRYPNLSETRLRKHTRSVVEPRARLQESGVSGVDLQARMGSSLRYRDSQHKPKEVSKPGKQLHRHAGAEESRGQARDEGGSISKVRRIQKRARV